MHRIPVGVKKEAKKMNFQCSASAEHIFLEYIIILGTQACRFSRRLMVEVKNDGVKVEYGTKLV